MDLHGLGPAGEKLACAFLKRAGHRVLATNVSYPPVGELDIVAMHKDELVVVEVKARRDGSRLGVLDTVTTAKQRRVVAAARLFIRDEAPPHASVRFDVLTVHMPEHGPPTVEHHIAAFNPQDL